MTSSRPPIPMRPEGVAGALFGVLMDVFNAGDYRRAMALGEPAAGEALLEIGFGTGKFLDALARTQPRRLAGLDPAGTMLARARKRRRLRRLGDAVDLKCGAIGAGEKLPWSDGEFNAAFALNCFQFWPDPDDALAELRRVLVRNGRLVLVLRNHRGRPPAWLPNRLSRGPDEPSAAISAVRRAGFRAQHGATLHEIVAVA